MLDWNDDAVAALARLNPALELENLVPVLRLESLSRALEAFQGSLLEAYGLGPSDYRVLAALHHPGCPQVKSPTRLAQFLGHTTGGMSKILRRLETRGFVERRADPEDRRGFRVEPTARGTAIWESVLRALAAAADQRLASLLPRQRDEIMEALALLKAALSGESRPR